MSVCIDDMAEGGRDLGDEGERRSPVLADISIGAEEALATGVL
jgi:hypothetical protein